MVLGRLVIIGSVAAVAAFTGCSGTSAPVSASPGKGAITVSPSSTLIGFHSSLPGTLTLSAAAPSGGITVALTSSDSTIVSVTAEVSIPAGATTSSFIYSGMAAGTVLITASASGYSSGTATVNADNTAIRLVALGTLAPGQQVNIPVTLATPAPTEGLTVNLSSSNPAAVTVSPASVPVTAGATSPSIAAVATATGIGLSTISANATNWTGANSNANVTVAATVSILGSIKAGSTENGTVSISAPAPAGGITFALSIDSSSVATVSKSATIAQGATQASFDVTGVAAGITTVRAISPNIPEADAALSVTPTLAQAIQHIVVIFDENVSFDHYFGTYPVATNSAGEPAFTAAAGTIVPAGLSGGLLTANPNSSNSKNGSAAINPFRLDRAQAATADQDHGYYAEQIAFDNSAMDLFPYSLGQPDSPGLASSTGAPASASTAGLAMGYFDGNTVTALWNYAQHYVLSDHFFETNFGPSTPGAINLISGQTNGVVVDAGASGAVVSDGNGGYTLIGDPDPTGDLCSNAGLSVHLTGRNVGDLLTTANVSWGWFEAGFDLTVGNINGSTGCNRSHLNSLTSMTTVDYVPHHEPFQYYASTANLNHVRPSSLGAVGKNSDVANHQYDLHDFADAIAAGNMPAVSFLKAPAYQDGHAGYSDPLAEQAFLVNTINAIEQSSFWQSTAIVIAYDDSDGWYDHMIEVVNASQSAIDALVSPGNCSTSTAVQASTLPGVNYSTIHAQGRCGYGPRLPLLLLSPWARKNYLYSTVIDQTSITRLVEDTFLSGKRIGGGSFDSIAGAMDGIFDFSTPTPQNGAVVTLDPNTGLIMK